MFWCAKTHHLDLKVADGSLGRKVCDRRKESEVFGGQRDSSGDQRGEKTKKEDLNRKNWGKEFG
jgi:hypothetical protein